MKKSKEGQKKYLKYYFIHLNVQIKHFAHLTQIRIFKCIKNLVFNRANKWNKGAALKSYLNMHFVYSAYLLTTVWLLIYVQKYFLF